jgi:deoxyhypusine synthase
MTVARSPTNNKLLDTIQAGLSPSTSARVDEATRAIVQAKKAGGKVVVITGSGPNIHEGVTTLVAELIRKEIVDGVITR